MNARGTAINKTNNILCLLQTYPHHSPSCTQLPFTRLNSALMLTHSPDFLVIFRCPRQSVTSSQSSLVPTAKPRSPGHSRFQSHTFSYENKVCPSNVNVSEPLSCFLNSMWQYLWAQGRKPVCFYSQSVQNRFTKLHIFVNKIKNITHTFLYGNNAHYSLAAILRARTSQ